MHPAFMCAVLVLASVVVFVGDAGAETVLPAPKGQVILTVGGKIRITNAGEEAEFDLDLLGSLDRVSFTTSTIWTEGDITFAGVPIETLAERLGATGKKGPCRRAERLYDDDRYG